jgi:hypothetical protein
VVTGMGELGIRPDVIELTVDHLPDRCWRGADRPVIG